MLAIKECLIREGVLNLTSTANHGNSTSLTAKQGNGGADGDVDDGGDGGIENTAVGGSGAAGAGANNTTTYRNHNYNDNVVDNNLRAISTNYTRNSDNRNNRNYDMASSLALDFQSVRLTDQISVDAARSHNTDTNNENKSSNCSLSSASATANSSCQQTSIYDKSKHLQQQKQQRVPATGSKSSTRYQGVHPHFHHHTAPSYYTDVNLHIHTPKANDVAALNENYQSVYNTTSQLVNERHFPKTSTATVVPPPIGTGTAAIGRANTTSPTSIAKRDRESVSANSSSNIKSSSSSSARAAFFRGGSVGSNSNGERKSCEHFTKSSPAFGRPTKKGEFNDTSYTPYDISGSSFVVGTLSSSDCSKTNQLDNTTDTHINTNHNNNHNSNNNIPLTSPTSAGHTSASASATASASASASASGRSRNSNRFAGKKRAVRVRSESRPISALYDIICKEKGLDIGTSSSSSSTTNEEEHSASASNDDENRGAHNKRSTNSKERCRQRSGSGSRNSNRNNSNDYSEISKRLTAFVAKSLSNHSGELVGQSNMDNVATVNSAAVDTKAAHDRSKRSHKSRTPSSQKSASKKRKDVGKTKASVMRCAMSDDEPNNETSEDSNELRANAVLSPLTKYHTEFSHKMNSTEKASSLPPRLQSATRTSSSSVKQALQPYKVSGHANTDLNTYPIVKKCPVHSRCDLVDCDYHLSSAHRPSHYTHAHHQSSLPPNLSSGPCSSIRSPSTADDDSLMVVNSLGYSPDKLFFEPVNMTLSSVSSGAVSGKNVNSSSSGVGFDQTSARSNQRIGRAQHRRLREEMRRHTDLPLLDTLSPNLLSSQLSTTERALSEDEGVAGVKQQKSRTSKARRFINRPSHTPTHGRSGNSANGSPHPIRRNSNKQNSESSSSASSPAPTNRRNSSANGINSINRPTVVPPINTVAAVAGVTIEDVGSASSGDHLNHHIKLSPLQIMTNSATPVTELPPRANGSAALGEGEAHPAEADMHDEAHEDTGNGSIGVQTIISDKKKCEDDPLQRPRSPCYGSASSPRSSASPKHQLSRLSTSSSSDNPHITASSESDTKLIGDSSRATIGSLYSTSSNDSPTTTKKLVPSVSVSVKQNLSEMQFNGDISTSGSPKKTIGSRLKKARTIPSPSTECTATFTRSAGRLSTADESDSHLMLKAGKSIRPRTSTMKSAKSKSISDLKAGSNENSPNKLELSPVDSATQPSSPREDRDKSSKRKSNLNRSLNDEATLDSVINLKYLLLTARLRKNKLFLNDSLAARRRRRRELGMVRQLVPSDDLILREMLLPHQKKSDSAAKKTTIGKSSENELAYHMEMARRGWDLANPSINNRARSETATSKYESNSGETVKEKPSNARLARRSDTLHLGELRKLRSNDVNRKMNERTKSDLAEIKKIAEQANIEMAMMTSGIVTELAELAVSSVDCEQEAVVELATPARYGIGSRSQASPPPTPSFTELEMAAEAKERDPSPAKHATFMQEERFYYDPETSDQISKSVSNNTMASGILRQRILKARSIERDAAHEPPKLSPILRRKSTDDPPCVTAPPTNAAGIHSTSQNHIVSILKKKDHIAGESSSASSNASPVTFSANVVDTPTTKQKRAGILKKRSSLDESRYYSRSHSPDERSILIKSARRNSLEETAGLQQQQQQQQQHGILKQSSYESSKSDGCPSATEPHPHSILKKKDSTSTPSDGGTHAPKHVSISQAVKMAAAELCRQTADSQCANTEHEESGYTPNNEEYEIRPILKLESASSDDVMRPPKPILKKKSSGDSDEYEIRPILKTSRKSSREEFDLSGSLSEDGRHYSEPPPPPPVRPILKTDSPSKRRSLGIDELEQDASSAEYVSNSPSLLKRRTRSLERQEPPVVDLAAALNAIATSQAAPLDFVSTPITTGGNISVAERIKNMEKFLSSNGASPSTPADVNSSWDSPLLHTDITPRLLKPSVIRRDMYRDRYKTQPVTNDEKMLFKATASPLDISATSAFKPTKSLDAGLNYTAFAHSNAASNASLGSSYTLTRCSTQSLHGQNHFDAAGTSSVGSPPLRAVIGRLNSLSDSYNNSGSEQLTHSVGSDSERIFEMSGIEENAAAASTLNEKSEVGVGVGGTGLARKNSVRARANMFQQLQEKTKSEEAATAESLASTATTFNREEQTSPRRAPRQPSPTPTMFATPPILSSSIASAANASCSEEHKTPQVPARTEEEIEPTSLPVSERLRFFANLTEAANRSLSSSYTRSPSQRHLTADRCGSANSYNHIHSITNTPRSSYNGGGSTTTSSASVTPTPMDCYSPPLSEPQLISINEIDSALQMEHNFDETAPSPLPSEPVPNATTHETSAFIKLSKSSSHTSLSSVVAQRLALSVPVPVVGPSALTPVARRIKMKTIGKLHLPQTFLNNDHNSSQSSSNNNNNISNNSIGNVYSDTCDSECSSIEAVSKPPAAPLKKIGKIKSPFIENCLQMEQKHHQLNSKYMKYDHKSTPHNALAALENNVANSGGGERDMNSLPQRKPLQNGNASLPPQRVDSNEDSNTDSGKENNYGGIKAVPLLTISPTASLIALTEQSHSPVVEMRKKFTRIMNGSSLSTVSQRLSAHANHTDNGSVNGKGNGNGNSSGVSSAPTTPRNSMIDEKYAKYFGLTSNNSHSQNCTTTTTNKTSTCKESSERARTQHSANNARLQFAGEKTAGPRHAPNYPPPPPPPLDFYHTTNGETHCPSKAKGELIVAMETSSGYDVHLTPFEAINHNVRSNSNTPYYTPPTTMPVPMTGNTLTAYNTAVHPTPSGIANVPQRRRDIAKRQRANTTNVTFTPTSSQVPSPHANFGTPSAGRTRTLRTRALTLTHGMPLPEVKRFEDIVVTKEDFQLASKEFERIFLGII
ncbi:pneumococcal serine-rich repeat protein-like isoform X3 [Anastrepha obliqua]|uniref:pneumococcal serine-rich repeat protein-like isoform X3 n=1 Tax=Anastrepha obliqua TaxID=95512 RepID=UPI00240A4C60|nr:pneumococcal serine-rich repeat protein-like isoform X3 [Anastrepha obliqua]